MMFRIPLKINDPWEWVHNLVSPVVHIKKAGKWMFIPLKMPFKSVHFYSLQLYGGLLVGVPPVIIHL